MFSPSTIANYFISKHPDDDSLTPMKLIKLVYIAYGWYLALTRGKYRLVNEKPQAWDLGPVFPSLYRDLKSYGSLKVNRPIPTSNLHIDELNRITGGPNISISRFLDTIWNAYGRHGAIYLSSITHTEGTPWSKVYPKGYNLTIPDNLIQEHYQEKFETNKKEAEPA